MVPPACCFVPPTSLRHSTLLPSKPPLHRQPPPTPIPWQLVARLHLISCRRRRVVPVLLWLPLLRHLARRVARPRPPSRRPWRVCPVSWPFRGLPGSCRVPTCLAQARHSPQASRVGGSIPGVEGHTLRLVSTRHACRRRCAYPVAGSRGPRSRVYRPHHRCLIATRFCLAAASRPITPVVATTTG